MELTLKQRKAVANGALPKFALGTPSLLDLANEVTTAQGMQSLHPSQIVPTNLTNDVMNANIASKVKPAAGGNLLGGIAGKASGIMNIASTGIDFFNTLGDVSKNKMTSDQMMGSGGLTSESANGISYQLSKVDSNGILDQIDATAKAGTMASMGKGAALGGAIGSVIPGLGTVAGGVIGGVVGGIAGLFGSRKAKREAERQKKIAIDRTTASNTLNREMAYTTGLRNEFNRENRTDISQSLFHAEEGIEGAVNPRTGTTYKKHIVNTAYGKVKAPLNAWVSKGEVIRSKDGSLYRVQSGDNDTARAYLQNGDSVYSKKIINPETGNSIADDAASYAMAGQLDRLDMNLNVGRMMKYAGKRKESNVLPGYLGGTTKRTFLDSPAESFTDSWNKLAGELGSLFIQNPDVKPGYVWNHVPPYSIGMNDVGGVAKYVSDPSYGATRTASGSIAPSQLEGNTNITPAAQTKTTPINVGTTNTGTPGSKTPGFLSKLWGGIKGVGSGFDLGNIVQLANAYSIAAQRDARAEGLRAPKSFVANQYEQDALQQLNSLHSDYYPVWAQNRELEGRGKSSIMQSGGLSAGQKMLGYMGLTNQTQQNNASALFEHQGRENALRAQAAKASLEAGNLSATRQQQAYQWDEDMLAKAHAARENMLETSAYDRQNALESFFANKFKKNQFDRTMNLYESQLKNDEAATRALIDNLNNTNTNNTVATQTTPTLADKASSVTTTAGTASIHPGQTTLPSAIPMIKAKIPQSVVKPVNSKRGRKTTMGTKKSSTKSRTSAVASTEGSQFVNKPADTQFKPFAFGNNPAIEERFPNASKEAKLSRPNKEKAGRPAPTSNAEALSRVLEKLKLGKKEYERRYGKGS